MSAQLRVSFAVYTKDTFPEQQFDVIANRLGLALGADYIDCLDLTYQPGWAIDVTRAMPVMPPRRWWQRRRDQS